MEPFKPDMIITNCPGCPYFLDRWQYVIREMEGKSYGANGEGIPVFTYEEVAGLVLGYDPWELGLQLHQKEDGLCCGNSLADLASSEPERQRMRNKVLDKLLSDDPDQLITACPQCKKSLVYGTVKQVRDIAELVDEVTV